MDGGPKLLRWAFVGLLLLLGACSLTDSIGPPASVVTAEDRKDPSLPMAPVERPVAIVISSNAENYQAVASALFARGGYDYTKYSLDNASGPVIAELIAKQGTEDVVVVGEQAARSIRPGDGFNVYYCQVFSEIEFLDSGYKGVSALPPFALQLAHWREDRPGLDIVGVVASPAMELYVRELQAAAADAGVTLRYEQVETDKEALFVFRRMVPEVDGYIFLPDARILSPLVIQKMVDYGLKHDLSMLTYSPAIARLGASEFVTVSPADVANRIARLLDADDGASRLALSRLGDAPFFELAAGVQ